MLNYRKDGSAFWNQLAISAVRNQTGELLYHFASQKDISAQRRADALVSSERRLLMEVDHRALNALALVQSIVGLTRADSAAGFAQSVSGRVTALARAHRLLADRQWRDVDLAQLAMTQTMPVNAKRLTVTRPCIIALRKLYASARALKPNFFRRKKWRPSGN